MTRAIRVSKVDYHPREYEYNKGDRSPLQVIIKGTDRDGEFQQAVMTSVAAHMWVPEDVSGYYFWRLVQEQFSRIAFELDNKNKYPGDNLADITDLLFEMQKELRKQGKYVAVTDTTKLIKLVSSISKIIKIEGGWSSVTDGTPLWMIEVVYPWVVRDLRDFFPIHYQADVVFSEAARVHYCIPDVIVVPDSQNIVPSDIQPYTGKSVFPLRDWIVDIETGETEDGKFPDPMNNPTAPITAITFMNNRNGKTGGKIIAGTIAGVNPVNVKRMLSDSQWLKDNQWEPCDIDVIPPIDPATIEICYFYDSNILVAEKNLLLWEAQMLERIKPTHLTAWNSDFDSNYRKNRSGKGSGANRMPYMDWTNLCQVYDSMHGYEGTQENMPPSLSLEYVAGFELGYGKLGKSKVSDMMRDDPDKFLAYNIWDCVLVNRIDSKIRILSAAQSLADFHKTDIGNAGSAMKLIESNLMFNFRATKEVMPSVSCVQKLVGTSTIDQGGFVHDAPVILCRNLIVLDNKKEYVNIMITGNTDHKTFVPIGAKIPDGAPFAKFPSGNRYRLDIKGPVPEILKDMTIKRENAQKVWEEIKAEMERFQIGTVEFTILDDKERIAFNAQFNLKKSSNMYFGVYGTAYSNRRKESKLPSRLSAATRTQVMLLLMTLRS
jgi:DNA polymerase elongation subunit (family B)